MLILAMEDDDDSTSIEDTHLSNMESNAIVTYNEDEDDD